MKTIYSIFSLFACLSALGAVETSFLFRTDHQPAIVLETPRNEARSNALFSFLRGLQDRTVHHENAHRITALQHGATRAWFETGDLDMYGYSEHHSPVKPGITYFRYDDESVYTKETGTAVSIAGFNAEADIALDESLSVYERLPAQLSSIFYMVNPDMNDFAIGGMNRNKYALHQLATALLSWNTSLSASAYLQADGGCSIRVRRVWRRFEVEAESSTHEHAVLLGYRIRLSPSSMMIPMVETNGEALSLRVVLKYRGLVLDLDAANPRTMGGYRRSFAVSHTTYRASVAWNQRF